MICDDDDDDECIAAVPNAHVRVVCKACLACVVAILTSGRSAASTKADG